MNNKLKIVFCSIFAGLLLWLCVVGTCIAVNGNDTPEINDFVRIRSVSYSGYKNGNIDMCSIYSSYIINLSDVIRIDKDEYDNLLNQIPDFEEIERYAINMDYITINTKDEQSPALLKKFIGQTIPIKNTYAGDNYYKAKLLDVTVKFVEIKIIDNRTITIKYNDTITTISSDFYQITYFNE